MKDAGPILSTMDNGYQNLSTRCLQLADTGFPDWNDDAFRLTERALLDEITPNMASVVYFIASGNFVKIGMTTNLRWRLTKLRTSCPEGARLIGVMAGDKAKEAELHRAFEGIRHRAEWFRTRPKLLRYIVKHCKWPYQGFPGDLITSRW